MLKKIIYYLFFALAVFAKAQTVPNAFTINTLSGLPSDLVYDIYQDKRGFVWFATGKGICRFDGLQVKEFKTHDFPTKSVSNIQEDYKGRIWFQDFNGNIMYVSNNKQFIFKKYKANGFLRFGFIDKSIVIAGREGVKIFDLENFNLLKTIPAHLNTVKHTLVSNNIFYLFDENIRSVDKYGKLRTLHLPQSYNQWVTAPIPVASNDKLYVFSKFSNQYYIIKGNDAQQQTLPFQPSFTQNAAIGNGEIWLSTPKGIHRYNPSTKKHQHYFPYTNVSHIIQVRNGKYWISTINNGAMYVDDFDSNFVESATPPAKLSVLNNEIIFSTHKDDIYKILPQNTLQHLYDGDTDHTINPLLADNYNNQLLFASTKFIIKSPTQQLESILAVKQITQLDAKYFVLSASTWSGVIYTDPQLKSDWDETLKKFPTNKVNGIYFVSIIEGEDGKDNTFNNVEKSLYLVTNYGVKKIHRGKIYDIPIDQHKNVTRIINYRKHIYILCDDEILYEIKNNSIEKAYFKDLKNQNINKIKVSNGLFFLQKEHAIFVFDDAQKNFIKTIDIPKGLDFFDVLYHDNNIYYTSQKGIIKTSASNYATFSPVNLIITDILVNGISKKIDLNNLRHDENNIEILYDVISDSPNNNYTIRIKVDDNPWEQMASSNRILRLTSLSFGNHVIKLEIENGKQIISKEFILHISSPFWQKWWFITLIILASLLGAYAYFKRKLIKNNEKNSIQLAQANLEKSLNQSKLKSLKSQMNPHFFFNALNTLQSYILANEKKEAVSYLSKFSRLTRSILEMSDKDNISIEEEVATLTNYLELEKARFAEDFNYTIDIAEDINRHDTYLPSLLLQPFVENAIKHGLLHKKGTKNLCIKFKKMQDYILISIEDDGIGRRRSSEINAIKNKNHRSFATHSIEERINLLNTNQPLPIQLTYTDKDNHQGTIVTLHIPQIQHS